MNCNPAPASQIMLSTSRDVVADEQNHFVHQEEENGAIHGINLLTWEPRPSDIVSFQCTEELTGRIFLIPTGTRLFILDFVDQEKHRVLNTGLHVYTTGFFGEAYRDRLFNYSHDPYTPLQSPLPIFILNPAGTIEITPQELPDNVMKTIVFPCSRGVYRPVVL